MSARGGDVRTPPHSIEAEQAVLGGLLLDSQSWDNVADVLRSEDFYRPDHRIIFDAIGKFAALCHPSDGGTVRESTERRCQLTDVGRRAYHVQLSRAPRTTPQVPGPGPSPLARTRSPT